MSRRVKSLRLARRVQRGWFPEMAKLGLTRHVERRGETITVTPTLDRMQLTEWGLRFETNLTPLGARVKDLADHREQLESTFVADFTITKIGHGQGLVDARHTDPLGRPVPVDDLPASTRRLHVVPAIDAEGNGVELNLRLLLMLLVAATRAGKSTYAWTLIYQIQRAGVPLRLRVFDPKQQEFSALRHAAHDYESDPARWPDFLGRLFMAMRSRQKWMAGKGWRELWEFTEENPLDLTIVDETLTVAGFKNHTVRLTESWQMKAGDVLSQFASQCLAAGYGALFLAQLGQKETLGEFRDLVPVAGIMRVPPQAVELVNIMLGPGAANLYPAHELQPGPRTAGIGYIRDESGRVVRNRAAGLTEDQRHEVKDWLAADKRRRAARKQQSEPEKAGAVA